MSIFDIFKPQSNDTKVEKLISLLKEKTAKNGYKLVIDEEQTPSIFDSKLGGIPYWDLTKEFPKDSTNQNMQLLAQINFEQITSNNSDLPQKGLLQFFITAQNTDYGVDFSNPTEQNNFRIVYHEQIDTSVTVETINKLNIPQGYGTNSTPIQQECFIKIEPTTTYIQTSDSHFDETFCACVKEIFKIDWDEDYQSFFRDKSIFKDKNDYARQIFQALNNKHNIILGNPSFTQEDPRSNEDKSIYDTLLLQLNSYSNSDYIMWGDTGIGNFFINSNALKEHNFSKVLYNWDC